VNCAFKESVQGRALLRGNSTAHTGNQSTVITRNCVGKTVYKQSDAERPTQRGKVAAIMNEQHLGPSICTSLCQADKNLDRMTLTFDTAHTG